MSYLGKVQMSQQAISSACWCGFPAARPQKWQRQLSVENRGGASPRNRALSSPNFLTLPLLCDRAARGVRGRWSGAGNPSPPSTERRNFPRAFQPESIADKACLPAAVAEFDLAKPKRCGSAR